jgi:hypothetical protein
MSIFGTSGKRDRTTAMANAMEARQTQAAIDARLNAAQGWATQTIDGAQPAQLGALKGGYDQLRADYDRAAESYSPYTQQGQQAWTMLGNATGLNGAAGNDAATSAFRASPGYQWQANEAMDQAARGASASGQLLSGNAAREMQDRASHLADQEYGQWYGRVKDISDTGYDAINKVAALRTGQGDAAYRYGGDMSNIWGTNARSKAGIYTGMATAGANALAGTRDRIIDANNTAMKGGDTAEANNTAIIKDLIASGVKVGGSIFGKV